MASFTLQKRDRLKSRKLIDTLFSSGQSSFVYPLKMMHLHLPDLDSKVKMAVTVPKRQFKKAVDRNKVKRKIREAYRQLKPSFEQHQSEKPQSVILMFIYVGLNFWRNYKVYALHVFSVSWIKEVFCSIMTKVQSVILHLPSK